MLILSALPGASGVPLPSPPPIPATPQDASAAPRMVRSRRSEIFRIGMNSLPRCSRADSFTQKNAGRRVLSRRYSLRVTSCVFTFMIRAARRQVAARGTGCVVNCSTWAFACGSKVLYVSLLVVFSLVERKNDQQPNRHGGRIAFPLIPPFHDTAFNRRTFTDAPL